MTLDYTIIRIDNNALRLDRTTPPYGAVAFALLNHDRLRNSLGWRLKPIQTLRASKTRLWPSPEDAFASTKLISASQARAAIHALDKLASPKNGGAL